MTTTPMNHLIKRSGSLAGRPPALGSTTSKIWGKPRHHAVQSNRRVNNPTKSAQEREDSLTESAAAPPRPEMIMDLTSELLRAVGR
jgi:hypothetical protein